VPTPTGFAEIVSDAFPVFHALQYARLRFSGQRDYRFEFQKKPSAFHPLAQ
jgi:hypothetical protein